jgi:hypothetical protein
MWNFAIFIVMSSVVRLSAIMLSAFRLSAIRLRTVRLSAVWHWVLKFEYILRGTTDILSYGARYLTGENLGVVCAEFSTLS